MNPLLLRQLRLTTGIDSAERLNQALSELSLLSDQASSSDATQLLQALSTVIDRINETYDHNQQHLELYARSLELSSEELMFTQDKLLQLSRTDRMTGLWNRGYWQERLVEEFRRAKRYNLPVSLVIADIDHFKRINDNYGHPAGDVAILWTAEQIKKQSRDIDICSRYGGEEFAVILPGIGEKEAKHFCERLRKTIEENEILFQGQPIKFTMSLGVAAVGTTIEETDSWLIAADNALYQAKALGRNCTFLASAF